LPLIRAELQRRRLPRPGPLLHDLSQVLYLPFDHDDGSYARDRSGYDNHGTVYGATRIAGKVASALSFDGVDDYVRGTLAAGIPTVMTTLFWLKWVKKTGNWVHPIGLGITHEWTFYIYEPGRVFKFKVQPAGEAVIVEMGVGTLSEDTWYHVALMYDGSKYVMYLNGVLNTSSVAGPPSFTNDNFTIGNAGDLTPPPGTAFKGIIDEVRVYNRALSATEIQRLMNMRGI